MSTSLPTSVLFVCLGNICRSPLAEGVFVEMLSSERLDGSVRVDSAGTGAWHVGERADPRARQVAMRHGLELHSRSRSVTASDFHEFDLILAMDDSNLRDLQSLKPHHGSQAEIRLFREFDPEAIEDHDVPDPYYGGPGGFDRVYEMVERSCRGLVATLVGDRS